MTRHLETLAQLAGLLLIVAAVVWFGGAFVLDLYGSTWAAVLEGFATLPLDDQA